MVAGRCFVTKACSADADCITLHYQLRSGCRHLPPGGALRMVDWEAQGQRARASEYLQPADVFALWLGLRLHLPTDLRQRSTDRSDFGFACFTAPQYGPRRPVSYWNAPTYFSGQSSLLPRGGSVSCVMGARASIGRGELLSPAIRWAACPPLQAICRPVRRNGDCVCPNQCHLRSGESRSCDACSLLQSCLSTDDCSDRGSFA